MALGVPATRIVEDARPLLGSSPSARLFGERANAKGKTRPMVHEAPICWAPATITRKRAFRFLRTKTGKIVPDNNIIVPAMIRRLDDGGRLFPNRKN